MSPLEPEKNVLGTGQLDENYGEEELQCQPGEDDPEIDASLVFGKEPRDQANGQQPYETLQLFQCLTSLSEVLKDGVKIFLDTIFQGRGEEGKGPYTNWVKQKVSVKPTSPARPANQSGRSINIR